MSGRLIVASTPIGNLGDVAVRLAEVLASADLIYAEDTRRTGRLIHHLGVSVPLRSYFVGNEESRRLELSKRLAAGETVALVTDAGTPGISDPGYTAVQAAIEVGAEVTIVPGPSAATAAIAASGLPSDRFVFEGFLPRKGKARKGRLEALAPEVRTIVLFTSKVRLVEDLEDLAAALGDSRRCAVARELTKAHEEIWRGTMREAIEHWRTVQARGEFTIVLEGAAPAASDLAAAVADSLRQIESGASTADAVRSVAETFGVSRGDLYEAVLRERSM